jgi:SAM-dependent methyltransferase
MWLAIRHLKLPQKTTRVLHFAPELGIAVRLSEVCGSNYLACDLDPKRYSSRHFPVRAFDLCRDTIALPDKAFDLILHNHVLEHLPCNVENVIRELDRILAPDGVHLFSIPIRGNHTLEDISSTVSPEQRRKLFGQEDHLRVFGQLDIQEALKRIWLQDEILFDFDSIFDEDYMRRAGIPTDVLSRLTSHSIFYRKKPI